MEPPVLSEWAELWEALGGDISTIGTNPAGIGIYRSNDAMLTFGYSMTGTESNYVGNKFETNKNRWSLIMPVL